MNEYLDSVIDRDPAARSRLNVLINYPGVKAVAFYKLSHFLWKLNLYLLARMVSQFARFITGVEIHPGATIGKNLFLDHANSIVIGESSIIGDNCTIYHGVTLGGLSPSENSQDQVGSKRHPTIEDNVIIGCQATILGPITVGHCSRIGASVVVLKDIPPYTTVVSANTTKLINKDKDTSFKPYAVKDVDDVK
tara:strand:- start:33 stop:611 length:579 start_codon:yes stop_codon:yes gene_type:complete